MLKKLWIPFSIVAILSLIGHLLVNAHLYGLLADHYNEKPIPPQPFNAALWPKKPYTPKQLPIRQSMTDSILKEFRPGLSITEIVRRLGPPDRIENQTPKPGTTSLSYIVLQDFASGPFTLCFVFDTKDLLQRAYYRWG